jgi:CelD/BcsL family acetyltransferase involved in cellulose biosynthesis
VQLTVESRREDGVVSERQVTQAKFYQRLEDLPEGYEALFSHSSRQSFFFSKPWFQNLVETGSDPGEEVRIIGVEVGGKPAAALVGRHQAVKGSKYGPRTLSSLTSFYTSLYAPLRSPESSASHLTALARAISSDRPTWDAVDLKWLDRDAPDFGEMQAALREAGFVVQTYFLAGNWYFPVNGRSFKEYFEGLRSSVRNIAKSKNRKIERTGRARVEIITSRTGLEPAVEAYQRIYASSWKVPEPYPKFIPGLAQMCADEGWLRLGVVYVDEEPAAAQIWIVQGGKAAIYKIAYDKRFADLSVGSFLTTRMMEHVLDVDKVQEVDYLTGDDKYKQDWMSDRRERWGILALNPRTLRGTAAIAWHVGGRSIKRFLSSTMKRKDKKE